MDYVQKEPRELFKRHKYTCPGKAHLARHLPGVWFNWAPRFVCFGHLSNQQGQTSPARKKLTKPVRPVQVLPG